jgi:starch synthase
MPLPSPRDASRPSVLIIGSEALPFAKTGGLADVLGALPPALARLGWDVTVALPRYRGVTAGELVDTFPVAVGGYQTEARFHQAPLGDGARAILVDVPDLYDREGLYHVNNVDYWDNPRRFAVLTRAALEFAARGRRPLVVHGHDWHAGLAPVYLKTVYAKHPILGGTPSVFTIHNLGYQGNFAADWLPRLDLPWDLLSTERLEFWGRISFLKGGINYAEKITTVSPKYAQEIQTPDSGFGFDGIIRRRRADLEGILNGIDTSQWDPEHDPFLPASFGANDLAGKRAAKAKVLRRSGLSDDAVSLNRPLVGMISRMVDQKGFDLIADIADELPALDASFLVLGTGEPRYEDMWRELAAGHPDRIGATIGFDEELAHLIEGGADIFLMPSQWEPCGLNQMYSLRYGTVPVVRGVGGLADTVRDYAPNPSGSTLLAGPAGPAGPTGPTGLTRPKALIGQTLPTDLARPRGSTASTGFVFNEYTPEALLRALGRALALFRDKQQWQALQVAGMKEDHSWDRSAREYVKIYEEAVGLGAKA